MLHKDVATLSLPPSRSLEQFDVLRFMEQQAGDVRLEYAQSVRVLIYGAAIGWINSIEKNQFILAFFSHFITRPLHGFLTAAAAKAGWMESIGLSGQIHISVYFVIFLVEKYSKNENICLWILMPFNHARFLLSSFAIYWDLLLAGLLFNLRVWRSLMPWWIAGA